MLKILLSDIIDLFVLHLNMHLKTSIKYGLTHPEVKDNLRQYIIDLAHELESKKEEK